MSTLQTPSAPPLEGYPRPEHAVVGECDHGLVPIGNRAHNTFLVLYVHAVDHFAFKNRHIPTLYASPEVAQALMQLGFKKVIVHMYGVNEMVMFYPVPYGGGGLGQSWCAIRDLETGVWSVYLGRAYCSAEFLESILVLLRGRQCQFFIDITSAADTEIPHVEDVGDMMRNLARDGYVLYDPMCLYQARWASWGFEPDEYLNASPYVVEREGVQDRGGLSTVSSASRNEPSTTVPPRLLPANKTFQEHGWDKNFSKTNESGDQMVYLPLGSGANQLRRLQKWTEKHFKTSPVGCIA